MLKGVGDASHSRPTVIGTRLGARRARAPLWVGGAVRHRKPRRLTEHTYHPAAEKTRDDLINRYGTTGLASSRARCEAIPAPAGTMVDLELGRTRLLPGRFERYLRLSVYCRPPVAPTLLARGRTGAAGGPWRPPRPGWSHRVCLGCSTRARWRSWRR